MTGRGIYKTLLINENRPQATEKHVGYDGLFSLVSNVVQPLSVILCVIIDNHCIFKDKKKLLCGESNSVTAVAQIRK